MTQRKSSKEVTFGGRSRAQGLRIPEVTSGKGVSEVGSAESSKVSTGFGKKLVLHASRSMSLGWE